jgi:hypothetical protein
MQKTLIPALISLYLCGCSRPTEQAISSASSAPVANSAATVASAPAEILVVQSESPDRSVKTWWKYLDLVELERAERCKNTSKELPPAHLKYLPKIADAELLASIIQKHDRCNQEQFSRDIDEVKSESETRAIVFATVRNATPIPAGAEANEYDKKWRETGFKFKYLVEKSGGVWKISQVYKYDESNKYLKRDVWGKVYETSSGPQYPSFVIQQ